MEIYCNTVCPVCGATVEETPSWMHCPAYHALVCMKHCYEDCGYLDQTISIPHCFFRDGRKEQSEK